MKPIARVCALCAVLAVCVTALSACKKESKPEIPPTTTTTTAPAPTNAEGLTESDRAFAMYEAALERRNEKNGIDATLTGTATVFDGTSATEWTLDVSWVSEQQSGNIADYKDHVTETIVKNNEVTERNVYYGKGTLYTSQNGKKFRQLVDRKTALAETALFTLPTMTKAAFSSPLIVQEKGNTVISLPMNGDILSEELQADDGALSYLMSASSPDLNYTFDSVTATLSFDDDGNLVGFGLYYTVKTDAQPQSSATVSLSVTYSRVNKTVFVKLPDAENYEERVGSGLSKKAYAVMTDVVDLLFGADGKRVDDFEPAYAAACKQYEKAVVDEIVDWFEAQ